MHENANDKLKRQEKIEEYVGKGILSRTTFYDSLVELADKYNDDTAIIDDERTITYCQLKANADKMAKFFLSIGIRRGDVIGVQLQNCILFAEVCFGLWKIGAAPILLMPSLRYGDLEPVFERLEPIAYISPAKYMGYDYQELTDSLLNNFTSLKYALDKEDLDRVVLNENEAIVPEELEQNERGMYNDVAVVLLSSGTTGNPKLILRTHAEYVYSVRLGYERVAESRNDTYLLSVPVQHVFGFAQPGMLGSLFSGAKLIMTAIPSIDQVLELTEKYSVTVLGLVPSMLTLMTEVLPMYGTDLSLVRVILTGGAPLPLKLRQEISEKYQIKLIQGYGFSEGLVCTNKLDDEDSIAWYCQGVPLSEHDIVKIIDENGKEVEQGEFGELIVNGPCTITSYYMNEEVSKEVFTKDGFFCSGDYARITPEGNVQVTGRVREQINRSGEKVMPSEVEEKLCKHPNINQAVVVGVPSETQGQTVFAFVMTDGTDITLAEINSFLEEIGMSFYKRPEYLHILDEMPLTKVGKVDRKVLENKANDICLGGKA